MRRAIHELAVPLLAFGLALGAAGCTERAAPETSAAQPSTATTSEGSPAVEPASPPSAPSASEPAAPAAAAAPAETQEWLLSEFDWGDTKNVVYESVHYTDGFLCFRHKFREHCAFVKARVDGEELLAKFQFVDDALWRIKILTPDLDEATAYDHLERIWKLLSSYVTRFQGAAAEQHPFPDWGALAPGELYVTQLWTQQGQEIRILVGRSRDEAKWFTEARFTDPKWVKAEPKEQREVERLPARP